MKMKVTKKQLGVFIASLMALNTLQAQESDTIPGVIEKMTSDIKVMNNLKISGYVQVQGQWIEKQDNQAYKVPSVAGGDFPAYYNDRFGVRRGRLKFAYSSNPLSQFVIQFDATEKGMGLKDAYVKFTEPFAKIASITAGVFNRPFGYEIEYSSSSRETPERSRMIQALFPQERDLGAMLTLQAPKTSNWNFIKLDIAGIAGNGINQDIDKYKDVIARLNFVKSYYNEKLKLSGGLSYYYGGFANQTKSVYKVGTDTTGKLKFIADTKDDNLYKRSMKELKGIDMQVSADMPWGLMTFRGEYITGQQPSTASSNVYPTTLSDSYTTTASTKDNVTSYTTKVEKKLGDTYIRNVNGYYFYFVQNILQSRHQIVIKYDVFNPNAKVSGTQIDGKNFTTADMMYKTLGIGYILKIDANTKLMIYGDFVKNEKTKIGATKDSKGNVTDPGWESDRKDNVLTVRLQYKF